MAMRDKFNLPNYEWQFLQGWKECQITHWYRYNFVFAYELDGQLYEQKWDLMPEAHRELFRTSKIEAHHHWRSDDGTIGRRWF